MNFPMDEEKEIRWLGSAYEDLLAFPDDARREAGFQLGKVQAALEPTTGSLSTTSARAHGKSESGRRAELTG
jgi:phage-related protein